MHSRIFKLQLDLKEEYKEITEWEFEDNGFIDGYHDYVRSLNEEETIDGYEWLIGSYGNIFRNFRKEGDFYFVDIYKDDVKFEIMKLIERIKEEAEALNFDHLSFYKLSALVDGDESGFYFYVDNTYYTDTQFLVDLWRYYLRDKEMITFRLEGALDYHS